VRPRVIVWTDHTTPYGVGRFSSMLSAGLTRLGWAVTYAGGIDLFGDTPMRAFTDVDTPASVMDEAKPDLVVFVNASPLSNAAAQRVARERGLTRAVVVQGGDLRPPLEGVEVLTGVAARELRAANAVVTPSHVLLAELRGEALGLDAGSVIPNGVPDEFFIGASEDERRSARSDYGLPGDAVVCLSGARMEYEKGWDLLLEAVVALRDSGDARLHFLWAGDGTKRKRLTALVRMRGVADRVRVLGLVRDMVPLVRLSDIFVLPTRDDVAPFAILEAMAGGLSVVSTDVREIRTMIGGDGIVLADPSTVDRRESVGDLTDALRSLSENAAARRELGRRARDRADRENRASLMVARYDNLLHSLI
jgi:glycosyltransferase involved in cell wall biosynthesis